MSVIVRVTVPASTTVQVIPPDGQDHGGVYDWTVLNPASGSAAVDLVDSASKTSGQGLTLATGAAPLRFVCQEEQVWAAAGGSPAVVHVLGVSRD